MTNKIHTMNQDMSYLHDWVFHYNSITDEWAAIPRGTYTEYWNDYKNVNVLRSKNINTLLDLLHKLKGNTDNIEELLRGKSK